MLKEIAWKKNQYTLEQEQVRTDLSYYTNKERWFKSQDVQNLLAMLFISVIDNKCSVCE